MDFATLIGLALKYGPTAISLFKTLSPEIGIAINGLAPLAQKIATEAGHSLSEMDHGSLEHNDATNTVLHILGMAPMTSEQEEIWMKNMDHFNNN